MMTTGGGEEKHLLYEDVPSSSQSSRTDGNGNMTLNTKIITAGLGIILVGLTALAVLQSDASQMEVLDLVLFPHTIVWVIN